jgi:hypothetical protein
MKIRLFETLAQFGQLLQHRLFPALEKKVGRSAKSTNK